MGLSVDVLVDGARNAALSDRFRSLEIVDGVGHEADSATLVVSVPDALQVALPPLGAAISFQASRDGGPAWPAGPSLYTTAVAGSSRDGSITVEAEALAPKSSLREERDASWTGQSINAIATAIAERAGLVPAVSTELADVVPEGAIQAAEPDRQFLGRLLGRLDGRFVVKEGRLLVLAAGQRLTASGAALPVLNLNVSDDGSWVRWRRADPGVRGSASARYYGGTYGSAIKTVTVGEGGFRKRLPGVWSSEAEAVRAAERALLKGRASRDWIEIDRRLTLGARALYPMRVTGAPDGFTEALTIQEVRHSIGEQVASTLIQARP